MNQKTLKIQKKMTAFALLESENVPLTLPEIQQKLVSTNGETIPDRTLRRWLVQWCDEGLLQRTGQKRGTRYQFKRQISAAKNLKFLHKLPTAKRRIVLAQLRDLWTHTSTALEGNTLTLGDTHAVLEMGLTVSGKPLREHQEIVGHAKAIDLIYQSINQILTKELVFALHKAVQTDLVIDIYQPIGAWKVEVNGTYTVTPQGKQVYFEYAEPRFVDALMAELINVTNSTQTEKIDLSNAPFHYAKIHMALVHIHPFFDGNGRIARLLANALLLKAGLPPLMINQEKRREYIQMLASYQLSVGQLNDKTGLWPVEEKLVEFSEFCREQYKQSYDLLSF